MSIESSILPGALSDLWQQTVQVWETSFLGVNTGNAILAVILLVLSLVLRGVIAHHFVGFLSRITKRSKTKVDDELLNAIEEPLKLIPVIFGLFFALRVLGTAQEATLLFDKVLSSLIAFAIFWSLVRAVDPLVAVLKPLEKALTPEIMSWVRKAAKGLFVFVGGAAILELWGIQVGPFLAGLGIFGVAVALGAQDLFKNLIAGFLVLAEKRFQVGDWIKVDGVVEGTVELINFRSTTIRRFDKSPVYVPNANLSDNAVTNFSRMTSRRIYWKIGLVYDSSVEQLRAVRQGIHDYIMNSDDFVHPPDGTLLIHIDSFNESSIDLMVYCFTKTTNWGEWLQIKEEFAMAIKQIVAEAGSDFAFPTRTLHVQGPGLGELPSSTGEL
ncbi:MAG: mechanosensitive ion channel family protein [Robiginitomaculum sp.]|nr:mechanosensitive ion channel family protein [Robiginitomaculum sp.]